MAEVIGIIIILWVAIGFLLMIAHRKQTEKLRTIGTGEAWDKAIKWDWVMFVHHFVSTVLFFLAGFHIILVAAMGIMTVLWVYNIKLTDQIRGLVKENEKLERILRNGA